MKRVALFVLPMLATFVVIGLGNFAFRTHAIDLRARVPGAREAVADALDAVADHIEEAVE